MTDDAETDEGQDHLKNAYFDLIIDSATYHDSISVPRSLGSILIHGTITRFGGYTESYSDIPFVGPMPLVGSIKIGDELYVPGSHSISARERDAVATSEAGAPIGCLKYLPDSRQCYVALYFPPGGPLREQLLSNIRSPRSLRIRIYVPSSSIFLDRSRNLWLPKTGVEHAVTRAECAIDLFTNNGLHPESAVRLARARLEAIFRGSAWIWYGWKLTHRQFITISSELVASILLKPGTEKLDTDETDRLIYQALQIASDCYDSLATAERDTRRARQSMRSRLETKGEPTSFPWRKRKLVDVFLRGADSPDWSSDPRIDDVADEYLSLELDAPTLEWLIVDVLVYRETIEYGEVLKKQRAGYPFGSRRYWRHAANIERMRPMKWIWDTAAAVWGLVLLVAAPIWLVEELIFGKNYDRLVIVGPIWLFALLATRLYSVTLAPVTKKRQKENQLFARMASAYEQVQPDCPPAIVREALWEAAKSGAVWTNDVWTIVLKAERRDEVFWRQPSNAGESSRLADRIRQTIDEIHDRVVRKEARAVQLPNLSEVGPLYPDLRKG